MAHSDIVPDPHEAENDFKNLEAEFDSLSRELAEKELELATLENELSVFEKIYARAVGVLFAELDDLDKEIAKELFRLHPEEKYKAGFQTAERKARASQDAVNEKLDQGEKKTFVPSEDLKNLFRKVAKTIHPDLAINEEERAYRTILMARANTAYKNGDKEALEQILFEWDYRDEKSILKESRPDELDQLEKKILQIRLRLKEIEIKIVKLKNSELFQLMIRVEQAEQQGHDLLTDMAKDIQRQIQDAKGLLNNLKQQEQG